MATRVSSPLFIGRQTELETLTDAVAVAAARQSAVVLIGGDAGIGKSRLVAELAARASTSGALVLEGGCISLDEASSVAAVGVERLRRTEDQYYVGELMAIAARAEADLAEVARARRDAKGAEAAAARAGSYAAMAAISAAAYPDPDSFGGRLPAYAAIGSAEARRATGEADVESWRAAAGAAERTGSAWLIAYTRYRLGEALLGAHAPRREAETACRTPTPPRRPSPRRR